MERTLAVALAVVAVLAVALPGPAALASRPSGAVTDSLSGWVVASGGDGAPPGSDGAASVVAQARATNPIRMPNTTAKLVLPGGTTGAGLAGQDLGAAIAAERRTTTTRIDAMALQRRFEAADTDAERAAVVRAELDRIGNRTRDLRAEEQRAYRQYVADNRSVRSLLVALAQVDTEARLYRDRIRRVAELATRVSGVSLRTPLGRELVGRARSLDWELETLTGPVRQQVARTYRGSADGGLVYVAAADEGVVVATMVGDTYAREALRLDRFERGPGHPVDITDLATEAYPWTVTNEVANDYEGTVVDIGVWRLRLGHPQGELRTYLDRGTESIFREIQRLQPERLPTERTATAENDGLRVRVNQTFRGGPLNVTVVDNATGRPVGSVVTVADHRIGRTGPDGTLWTVAPAGSVTVTVRQGPNTVNVSVPAAEHPTAG